MMQQQNPMLQALKSTPNNSLSQIKNMVNMVRSAGNPQAMLQSMIQSNPQLRQVMEFVNQSGGDAQAAFYKMAEQKGVNPEQVLSILRGQS